MIGLALGLGGAEGGAGFGGGGGGGGATTPLYEDFLRDNYSTGLLGYYTNGEPSGAVLADDSGNGNDGTITNSPDSYGNDGIGNSDETAIQWDSDSYAALESAPGSDFRVSEFTVIAWFRRLGAGGTTGGGAGTPAAIEPMVTKGRGEGEAPGVNCNFFLGYIAGSGIGAFFEESAGAGVQILGGTEVVDTDWHMAVFTYDGANLNLYLDGSSDATPVANANGPDSASAQLAAIAGALTTAGANAGWWNGDLAHCSVHNYAMDSDDISDLWENGSMSVTGPTAALLTPSTGQASPTLAAIVVQLTAGSAAVDDATVVTGNVVLKRNGVTLTNGVDYTFSYASGTDRITLTAIGDPFDEASYDVELSASIEGTDDGAMTPVTLNVVVSTIAGFTGNMMLGALSDPTETELSGICYSNKSTAYMWAVGDSGSAQDLIPVRWNGKKLTAVDVVGASNTDWEDISVASVSGTDYIYISDTGNNSQGARTFRVYRCIEPSEADVLAGTADLTGDVETITVEMGSGGTTTTPDIETLIVNPSTGDMYFVTKRNNAAPPDVYKLAHSASYVGTQTATWLGTIDGIGNDSTEGYSANAVGGCARSDGMEILIKTYTTVYRNYRTGADTFEECLMETNRSFVDAGGYVGHGTTNWLNEDKGEAITYKDDDTYVTLSERDGNPFPQYYYAALRDQSVTEYSFQEGVDSYSGANDTYIDQAAPTTNNETTTAFDIDSGPNARDSMIHFASVFGAGDGQVPSAATILGGYLELEVHDSGGGTEVYESLTEWLPDIATMTWNTNPFNSGAGGSAQNDVAALPEGGLGLPTSGDHVSTGTKRIPLSAALLEKWKTTNYGLILLPNYPNGDSGFGAHTSDNATAGNRPKLVVYTET